MAGKLEGRVALVTGAARGIGLATATLFAREGADVICVDLDEGNARKAAEACGGRAKGYAANVAKKADVERVVNDALEAFGKIDILVNNAGITKDVTLLKMDEAQWDAVIDVNLKGVFLMGQAVAKAMVQRSTKGVILSTSSIVGLFGNFGQTNYVASKAGVIGMTKTWARELGRKGIRANAVAPGFIKTDMTAAMPAEVLEEQKKHTPLGRLGEPEDIAKAFLWLASDDAGFVTGQVLGVDGGLVIGT